MSTENVLAELRPTFPTASDCSACAVYVPAASAGETSTEYVASGCLVAVIVRTGDPVGVGPLYTFTVTLGVSPTSDPATPESGGVEILVAEPFAGDVRVTAGGRVSTRRAAS